MLWKTSENANRCEGSNVSNDSSSLSDPSETDESGGSRIDNSSIPPGPREPDESDVDDSDGSTPSSQSQTPSEPNGETISRQRNQPSSRARSLRPSGPIQEEIPINNGGRQGAPNNNRDPAGREGPANNGRERRNTPHQDANHAGEEGPVNEKEEERKVLSGKILGVERRIQQLHNECRYRMTQGPDRHPEPRKVMKLIKAVDMLDDLLQRQEWLNAPEPIETPEVWERHSI